MVASCQRRAVDRSWAASEGPLKHEPVHAKTARAGRACVQVPIDFTQAEIQAQMDASLLLFRENTFVVPETMNSWWEAFREHHGAAPAAVRPCHLQPARPELLQMHHPAAPPLLLLLCWISRAKISQMRSEGVLTLRAWRLRCAHAAPTWPPCSCRAHVRQRFIAAGGADARACACM